MSYKIKQATNLKGMTGAIGGTFYPNNLAEKVFVRPLEYGSVFAYLFRRFGYPIHGWDSDKDICSYTLTTPLSDVCLWVNIKSGVDFGYMISQELDDICLREDRAPYEAWHSRFDIWAKSKGYQPLYRWSGHTTQEDLDAVGDPWMAARGLTEDQLTDAIMNEFWTEQDAKLKVWREEYAAIDPWPVRRDSIYGETRIKVWSALEQAMRELLRPVQVDSTVIDIFGQVDSFGPLKHVKESPMAGLGIGWLYDIYEDKQKRESWWNAVGSIRKVGRGDLLAGIETLLNQKNTHE